MNKIAIIVTKSEAGGAQEYIRILMSLVKDAQFVLITGDDGYLAKAARDMNVVVHVCRHLVHPIRPIQDIKAIAEVYRILRREKPDLLHANSSKAGIVGRVSALLANVPSVFTAHGWAFTEGVGARRATVAKWMEKLIAPLTNAIICVSDYDRRLALKNGVGTAAQLITIHNGIPDREPSPQVSSNTVLRVVMVARFSEQKDYATLLHAMSRFNGNEIRLECVGDGMELCRSHQLAEQLGLQDRVAFAGARSDIPDILHASDVFVLTSHWEGLPISILEAMRAGLPVIASRVGGIAEAVEDQVTGFLVERRDVDAVANALQVLKSKPELRKKMGQAGRERYLKLFSAQHMVDQTGKVYESVMRSAYKKKREVQRLFGDKRPQKTPTASDT